MRILSFLFLSLLSAIPLSAVGFDISGRVRFSGEGEIYIMLTDEDTSGVPFEGIRKVVIDTAEEDGDASRCADFSFTDIPPGIYGIRCFQDENGNGKLDRGLFGPSEPWGMSWSGKKRMPPDFEDYSFRLDSDLVMGDIILNK